MLNIEEIEACQEIDISDVNLVKKLGEGTIGDAYKLQKTS